MLPDYAIAPAAADLLVGQHLAAQKKRDMHFMATENMLWYMRAVQRKHRTEA